MSDENEGERRRRSRARIERAIGRNSERIVSLQKEVLRCHRVEEDLKDRLDSTKPDKPGIGMRLDRLEQRQASDTRALEQRQKMLGLYLTGLATLLTIALKLVDTWLSRR
jgi:hypothetical protein